MDQSKIAEIGFLSLIMENLNINVSPISFISICMILIFSFRFALAILVNKKILFFCRDMQVALRSDLMKTYQNMSYEDFTENDSSDAIANTTVLSMYFTNNVLYSTLKAFAEVILAIFLFSFLLFINGLLVLILVIGLGSLVTLYSNFFKSRMISYGQKINAANSNLVQSVKQSMEGIKEVRVLGKENFFYKRYISNAETYGDLHASSQLINTGSRYFIEFAIIGFFVFTISASDFLMLGDSSDIFATLGMFAFAAIRLLPGVNVLSSAILQLRSQKNTVDRLYETLIDLRIEIDFSKIETDAYQENTNSEGKATGGSKLLQRLCARLTGDNAESIQLQCKGILEFLLDTDTMEPNEKEEFIANYDKEDIGYIESKYLGTLMLNNLKGREQKFLSLAFAYAKSSVKGKSCVHLKVY